MALEMQRPSAITATSLTLALALSSCAPESSTGGHQVVERLGMVLVPSGPFLRGCEDGAWPDSDVVCHADPTEFILLNVPAKEIQISEFWIDRYEVARVDWQACASAAVCTPLPDINWDEFGFSREEQDRFPITAVSHEEAAAFCGWAGKRLPTEAEWEKAARGTDGRRFPWGNEEPECGDANLTLPSCDEAGGLFRPVDTFPLDRSPYGAECMAGNVSEWVADWADPDYYSDAPSSDPQGPAGPEPADKQWHVARGFASGAMPRGKDISMRGGFTDARGNLGFRCASDNEPTRDTRAW